MDASLLDIVDDGGRDVYREPPSGLDGRYLRRSKSPSVDDGVHVVRMKPPNDQTRDFIEDVPADLVDPAVGGRVVRDDVGWALDIGRRRYFGHDGNQQKTKKKKTCTHLKSCMACHVCYESQATSSTA